MANEPITLFARIADLAAVARRLRELVPGVEIDGPDDAWQQAVVTYGKGKGRRSLTLTYDPDYCSEPNWSAQMSGMRGYLSRFKETDRKSKALMLTTTFRLSLGTIFDPDFDAEGDPRLDVLFSVAEVLDGILFTPSSIRDAQGRILFGTGGEDEEDLEAVWPRVFGEVSAKEPFGAALHERSRPRDPEEDDPEAVPPTPERVARRALALTALTARAIMEQDAQEPGIKETYRNLRAWVEELEIDEEFEPDECKILKRPVGRLESQDQINATWRLEGLAVLAWALGRFELPAHDQIVSVNDLWHSLGLLDAERARAVLEQPELRPRAEIATLRNRLFALHWRLRNYRIRPTALDFPEYARTCWFGPLDITDLPIVEGDLALGGERLDRTAQEVLSTAGSAAQERHMAVNWLWEGPEIYSEASVAT